MKYFKGLCLLVFYLFVSSSAFALEVDWHGDLNHRFMYSSQADAVEFTDDLYTYVNVEDVRGLTGIDTKKNKRDSDYFGELKYRLWMSAADNQNRVKGVFGIELGADKFGSSDADFGGDARGDIEFRWGYVDFQVPFSQNSRVAIGLQPVGYNYWVWGDNAAGVKWTSMLGNLTYSLGWFRDDVSNSGAGGEGRKFKDDVYAIDATYGFSPGNSLNCFFIYRDSGEESNVGGQMKGNESFDLSGVKDREYWVGLAGEGRHENMSGRFTVVYNGGDLEAGSGEVFSGGQESLDREAYMVHLEGTAKYEKTSVKLGWFYASGDDDPYDGKVENFNSIDTWVDDFGSIIVFDGIADDNSFSYAPYFLDRGNNTFYAHVDYVLTNKLTVGGRYIWLNSAKDFVKESNLGHEFGIKSTYSIFDGLTASLAINYLVGGDAWDELSSDGHGDNVFRTDFGLRYKF